MADNRQQKASAHKGSGYKPKDQAAPKETVYVDGHKKTVIKGEKVTVFWKGMEIGPENHSRPRVGKTAKDKASGAERRNYENKESRANWSNDARRSLANFPFNSCNGKRNRTVVTGRGNTRVTIAYTGRVK